MNESEPSLRAVNLTKIENISQVCCMCDGNAGFLLALFFPSVCVCVCAYGRCCCVHGTQIQTSVMTSSYFNIFKLNRYIIFVIKCHLAHLLLFGLATKSEYRLSCYVASQIKIVYDALFSCCMIHFFLS